MIALTRLLLESGVVLPEEGPEEGWNLDPRSLADEQVEKYSVDTVYNLQSSSNAVDDKAIGMKFQYSYFQMAI